MNLNIKKNQKLKLILIFFVPIVFLFGIFSFVIHQNYISQISIFDEKLKNTSIQHSEKKLEQTDWETLSMKDIDLNLLSQGKPPIGNPNDPLYELTPAEIEKLYSKEDQNIFLLGSSEEVHRLENLPYISQEQFELTQEEVILESFWFLLSLFLVILIIVGILSYFLMKVTLSPIEKNIDKQNQFIANASHELKTPLALIQSEAEVLLLEMKNNKNTAENISTEEITTFLQNIREDTKSLNTLINKLLTFENTQNTIKNQTHKTNTQNTNISKIIKHTAERIHSTYTQNKKLTLQTDISENIYRNISNSDINQITTILIDNACKYSKDNSFINITLQKTEDNKIIFTVKNTGSFIEESDIPHVFDRFFRASSHQNKKGHGLGLSLLKEIVEKNKGEINVSSNKTEQITEYTEYTEFKITFL